MKVIIFDIGNVLIDFEPRIFYRSIAEACQANVQTIKKAVESDRLVLLETSQLLPEDFMLYFQKTFSLNWKEADWIHAYARAFKVNQIGEGLRQRIIRLGCRVCLLSNLSVFSQKAVALFNPETLIGNWHNFYSYELGYHKPDKAIYLAVCDRLNIKPEQCIFFDDLEKNVEGARKAGMAAHQFQTRYRVKIEKILFEWIK